VTPFIQVLIDKKIADHVNIVFLKLKKDRSVN